MSASTTHIRRCHICGHTTEEKARVERCECCGKHMPKYYYFNEEYVPVYADNLERPKLLPKEYLPIRGVSGFWR